MATIHLVENWKAFNVIEDDSSHRGRGKGGGDFLDSFAERLRLMREIDENDQPESICKCSIF